MTDGRTVRPYDVCLFVFFMNGRMLLDARGFVVVGCKGCATSGFIFAV